MKDLLSRLRFFFSPKKYSELEEELRFHVEQSIHANIAAGMTAKEARRQALVEFGGVARVQEDTYAQHPRWWIETALQDVRYALRGFRRNPLFTVTVIATLALGIGATTAVFSVVDPILFRSLPYAHADQLVSIGLVQSLERQEFMLGSFFFDWRDNQKPFVAITSEGAVSQECDLTERNPEQLNCARVFENFLPILGISPMLGRNFLPDEMRPNGPKVALITYGLWRSRFNCDPGILNKLMDIDGSQVRVIGVLPKDFELPDLQPADLITPFALDESAQRTVNGGIGSPMRTFARLKPGVTVAQARNEIEPLFKNIQKILPPQLRNDFQRDFHLVVRSLRDRQMQDASRIAWILMGSVFAFLLIACANIASLLMARGAARQRELAVRSALGASRARLACRMLIEGVLLSVAGAVAGCVLASALLHIFIAIAPAGIPFLSEAHVDVRIISFTFIVSLLCGAFFSLAPALQKPRVRTLTGRSLTNASHAAMRRWLVVGQIAASIILLAGGMLLLRSFWKLQNQNLGMQTDNTLTVSITLGQRHYGTPEQQMMFFQQLGGLLRYGPGVSSLAMSDSVPPGAGVQVFYSSLGIVGRPSPGGRSGGLVTTRKVSPDYFHTLEIPIVKGEGFRDEELNASDQFIVLSKQLAGRLFPGKSAVGERVQFDTFDSNGVPQPSWGTVVGVAANVKNGGLTGEEEPEYYVLRRNQAKDWDSNWRRTEVFILRTSLPPEMMARWVHAQVAKLDPIVLVNVETMNEQVSKLADRPRFEAALLGFFAATGLLLAIIGLYGVISFLVVQRTQEIGVRLALGASRSNILRLFLLEGMRLIVLGVVLGVGAALALSRLLQSLLFGISPHDTVTFIGVAVLLTMVGLVATLVPARSAMKVDPMVALRHE